MLRSVSHTDSAQFPESNSEVENDIAEHWGWYLMLGIVLVIGGVAAIAFPLLSTIAAKHALGLIFFFVGVVSIVHGFSAGNWHGLFWNVAIGSIYVVAGAYLVFLPLVGVMTLTMLVAVLFLADGVLQIIVAYRLRPHSRWGWLLFSGAFSLIAGVMIWLQLPFSATWVIGVLVGIKMVFAGCGYIALALGSHQHHASISMRPQ
jgi:uncharacterized membrane protein HdeD (DUF308 family)